MTYTTVELVRVMSRISDVRDMPENELKFFIDKAAARIDTKLCQRYAVPFKEPVPPIINSIATDFAAGFVIEKFYSDRPDKNEPYLAEVLIERAESDLLGILDNGLLDGEPGIEMAQAKGQLQSRPSIGVTPYKTSEMEEALRRW